MLKNTNSVVGMNPRHPSFMTFIRRGRWQTVNDEIFRRALIDQLTAAQIDLKAANLTDALHTSQFGFAFT